MTAPSASRVAPASAGSPSLLLGAALVLGSGITWSFGGLFGRLAGVDAPFVVVFWRSGVAALAILAFIALRHRVTGGAEPGILASLRAMSRPAWLVAGCFALAMTSFVVALQYSSVANILLIQAGVPLIAALIARIVFAEPVDGATWAAIAAVLAGVAIMVSDSLGGGGSVGDLLALGIALAFATATVTTRRHAGVRMTPAVAAGALIACLVAGAAALAQGVPFALEARQAAVIAGFGLSLGLGLALFAIGARLIPSPLAALLGVSETLLGPLWVWMLLGEAPATRTLLGGAVVLVALTAHLAWQLAGESRPRARSTPPAA